MSCHSLMTTGGALLVNPGHCTGGGGADSPGPLFLDHISDQVPAEDVRDAHSDILQVSVFCQACLGSGTAAAHSSVCPSAHLHSICQHAPCCSQSQATPSETFSPATDLSPFWLWVMQTSCWCASVPRHIGGRQRIDKRTLMQNH